MSALSLSRLSAFVRKETLQVLRDPSSILIAFVLPLILLFLFGYGVSLDANTIRIGVVLEDTSGEALDLAHAFTATRYFDVTTGYDKHTLEEAMVASKLRGVVVIPQDFSEKYHRGIPVNVQVIADGSETNTASFVQNYANNVVRGWLASKKVASTGAISPDTRVWFNPELKSRYMLLPGALSYRYYVCVKSLRNGSEACAIRSIPAQELESAVLYQIKTAFKAPELIATVAQCLGGETSALSCATKAERERLARNELGNFEALWDQLFAAEQRKFLAQLVERVEVSEDGVRLHLKKNALTEWAQEAQDGNDRRSFAA